MEAVYAALIAMASAVVVKVLDRVFSKKDETQNQLASIQRKLDKTQEDVKALAEDIKEDAAIQCRQRILCFSDDLLHGIDHSKEYYDTILESITEYDLFCDQHPTFRNKVTGAAAKNILTHYERHMFNKDFL